MESEGISNKKGQTTFSRFSASNMFPGVSKSVDESIGGKGKNNWMFGPIDTEESATKLIKDAVIFYYFMAVLQGAVGYYLFGLLGLSDGILFLVLAFFLQKTHRPWPALMLLIFGGFQVVTTFEAKALGTLGGTNIYLALLSLWISVRAAQATYQLKKFKEAIVPANS